MLRSDLFRDVSRLQSAARNAPPVSGREHTYGVSALQAGLLRLGYKLPVSTRRHGAPDGIYGDETRGAVQTFQARARLKIDGIAGHDTLHAIDALLPATIPPAPPPKPNPKPNPNPNPNPPPAPAPKPHRIPPPIEPGGRALPFNDDYEEGTAAPPLTHDKGAGAWNSKPATLTTQAAIIFINGPQSVQFWAAALAVAGPHAVLNLKHYFANTGTALTIDYAAMRKSGFSAGRAFGIELTRIARYIDTCPPGRWQIRSKALHRNDFTYNYKDESRDWYYAVGGYSLWATAACTVEPDGRISADVTVHFYDRYNWDKGKGVDILGIPITDVSMAAFHQQGKAREYDMFGQQGQQIAWTKGSPPRFDTFKH
ncbi:hypothetical protein sos41_28800 [Alphaproteobacteria bacterium SO-S41]|nr:hypothetical protein sos41_28800 [Alphaproteobacteria bacterium SO-S41]